MTSQLDSRLNRRSFIVLLMFFSGVFLPPSGIVLHLAASAPLQPTRHLLMTIHNTAAIIFLISVSTHLVMSWKAILRYLVSKTAEYLKFRKEALVAAIAVVAIVGLAASHVLHVGS